MALNRSYFITMDDAPMGAADQVALACRAGVRLIQLRLKDATDEDFLRVATVAKKVCDDWGSRLIINDRIEVAAAVGADGVHVGKEDLPVREVRRLLGAGKIVGGTANTVGDVREHCLGGADYIGLGPLRYTATKKKLSPVLGLEGYRRVMGELGAEGISVPVFAIGGIAPEDVGPLVESGVYGVAFSGMLLRAGDPVEMLRSLEEIISTRKQVRSC